MNSLLYGTVLLKPWNGYIPKTEIMDKALVFYIEGGKTKSMPVPTKLKNKLFEEFKDKKSLLDLTTEELTEFLKKHEE